MIPLNDLNFNSKVLESSHLVLVSFGAEWSGASHLLQPILTELQSEYLGKIECYTLDIDLCPALFKTYGVVQLPAILFFKEGKVLEHLTGSIPKSIIEEYIIKQLN